MSPNNPHKGMQEIALALGGKIMSKIETASDKEEVAPESESAVDTELKTWSDIWRDFPKRFKRKPRVQTWQRAGASEIGVPEPEADDA